MKHELIYMDLLNARVCSSATWEEALEWLRENHAAGTANNWSKKELSGCEPLKCSDDPERTHYMFCC